MNRWLPLTVLLLAGCGAKPSPQDQAPASTPDTLGAHTLPLRPDAPQEPFLHAYLVEPGADTAALKRKWTPDDFADLPGNLLLHTAGGPHGAAWNPHGDLVVACCLQLGEGIQPDARMLLNGKEVKPVWRSADVSHVPWLAYYHFVVPEKTWQEALRQVKADDLEALYADREEVLDAWHTFQRSGDSSLIGIPPVVGEMAELEVRYGWDCTYEEAQKGFLHVAFGE